MKQTINQGYPYPECNPPYVKDAADLPLQLKTFAELVDDDVTALQAQAAEALNPPAAGLNGPAQTIASGASFDFNVVGFDNVGTMADTSANRINIPNAGMYMVTGFCFGLSSPGSGHQLIVSVNGAAVRVNSIHPSGAAANNVVYFGLMQAGDRVTLSQVFSGGGGLSYTSANLRLVRVVKI